ncbi:hypothetical protein [Mycobacterium gordonae]|uniref:Uncharacterized protein n=1 Tax=Mycobacterium gordonae TaxID=1778 RepID=A0A1X1X8I0_MYCGO|nr:hypothetical protein [Mycobacterium gordonae]MCV7005624.1 hypothetical protein [Mycobacterium gordonae]ODR23532.1 hypothetical protein BHQ23_04755 [Mycobacterium gordonae]ORV95197.1 hypothetical protein AWC08_15175 [Mycobacterium gordonae]
MLSAIAIVPCAPVLVPELAGAAGAEVAGLTAAVLAAAAVLPPRWIAVGTGRPAAVVAPDSAGTFAGFGVDVPVRLTPEPGVVRDMPLCALMAAWVRGQARPDGSVEVRVYAGDEDPATSVARGRRLRAEIEAQPDPIGVLVVADGANTLTARAPGGYDPEGAGAQQVLDDALAGGDLAALSRLSPRILGRVAFGVLAGLAEPGPRAAKELYRGAPYGVGYFAGVWQP